MTEDLLTEDQTTRSGEVMSLNHMTKSNWRWRRVLVPSLLGLALVLCTACGDDIAVPTRSLASPAGIASARSCRTTVGGLSALAPLHRCEEGEFEPLGTRTYGLIANREREALMVFDYDTTVPVLLDTDIGEPGVTGVPVCAGPREVAASVDGTYALVSCDIDRALSIVSLVTAEEVARLPRTTLEIGLSRAPEDNLFVLAQPELDRLVLERLSFECSGQSDVFVDGCEPTPTLTQQGVVDLEGTPADVVLGTNGRLYVTYQDHTYVSVFAVGGASEDCTDAVACELRRIGVGNPCEDGVDNDGDGLVDSADLQCFGRTTAAESVDDPRLLPRACVDGVDNDLDGLVDHDDPGCMGATDDDEGDALRRPACEDGVDNDGDGQTDADDADCFSGRWDDEARPPACADGIDNDGDTLIDMADPECLDPNWAAEGRAPQCANGIDDDGDGATDFPQDTDCAAASQDGEAESQCGNGLDDDADGFVDLADAGCSTRADDSEALPAPVCADGADNDQDGLVDLADPDCYGPAGRSEASVPADGLGAIALTDDGRFAAVVDRSSGMVMVLDLEAGVSLDAGAGSALHTRRGVEVSNFGVIGRPVLYEVGASAAAPSGSRSVVAVVPTSDGFAIVLEVERTTFTETGEEGVEVLLRTRDADSSVAAVGPVGCDLTDEFRDRVREIRAETSARRISCEDEEVFRLQSTDGADEVVLRSRSRFLVEDGVLATDTRPDDWEIRDDNWTLAYEAVFVERQDGLVDTERPGELVSVGADLCQLGIETGDRLVIAQANPALDADPEACTPFLEGQLEYEVAGLRSDRVWLRLVSDEGAVSQLPTRTCFSQGVSYSVRPQDTWVLHGELNGLIHDWTSLGGQCVRRTEDSRRTFRAQTGVPFESLFLGFTVELGTAPLVPDVALRFSVDNHFATTGLSTGPLPVDIDVTDTDAGRRLAISDGGANTVFIFEAPSFIPIANLF